MKSFTYAVFAVLALSGVFGVSAANVALPEGFVALHAVEAVGEVVGEVKARINDL